MSETTPMPNKYRAAMAVLQRGRERLLESLAEEVVEQGDDITESPYLFNEMVENQGTRLHYLSLLLGHLEHAAETFEEAQAQAQAAAEPPRAERPRRKRASSARSSDSRATPPEPRDEP